jgi:hypothetical protein
MSDAESPATLFELFRTHFEPGHKRIAYDNGCNLLVYALKRDPEMARELTIMVDELHYKGHKRCSQAFNARAP